MNDRKMIGVYVNIKEHRITVAGLNGDHGHWEFNGDTVEPGYEDRRKQLISLEKFKELEELDYRVLFRLSDKIVDLAKELGAGISYIDSRAERIEFT